MGRKKGVILSYILMIFEVLSTLLITPYMISTLGQAEYGVYKLSASITAYLLLLDLGVGNAIIRYISKYRANKDAKSEKDFFGVAIIFYCTIGLISLMGGVVLVASFSTIFSAGLSAEEIELGKKLLLITVVNAAVTIGTAVYTNVIVAYERFGISRGSSILQIILRMILTVVVLKLGMGSLGVVEVNLLMTILCRGFFVVYVFGAIKLRPNFRGIRFDFIKEILVYSSWILVQMVATQINASMDQILLGALVSGSAAIIAVYSVGTQVVQYFRSIGSSFTGVLMPGFVKLVEQKASGQRICDEMVRIGRLIFIILGLIWSGFAVFGQQFINLWAGSMNSEAYYVALILMTAYLLILTESIGSQILWAKNEHKEQALLKLGAVVLNIALTAMLIRWSPLLGAAIGTFTSLFVGDILVMNLVYARKLGISLRRYYTGLFKGLLPGIMMTVGLGLVINLLPIYGWGGLIIKIGAMCFVYALVLWLLGLNIYEKKLFMSLLKLRRR